MKHSLLKTHGLKTLLLTALFVIGGGGFSQVWGADSWVETAADDLTTGDVVVIVDKETSRAMSNNNGTSSAPSATAVTLSNDKTEIRSSVATTLQWVVTVSNGSYQFGVSGTANYLYATNTNNGLKVGTNTNNVFTLFDKDGVSFLYNTDTKRYIGVYNNQDWRCYTSINDNIKGTVTAIYKLTTSGGGSTAVSTTTTIDYSGITNRDIYIGTAAGTLTASVTAGEGTVEGATVTWSSSNETVATVNSVGEVTLVAAGTTTITANYAGVENEFTSSSATYTLTVINSTPATLPFYWAGGTSAALLACSGVTANGLGTDYADNDYKVKFDTTGDYIQIHTASQPGKVTIRVMMIGGANASTITVQESSDESEFKDVESLSISGRQNDVLNLETTNAFKSDSRYVRLNFTKGSNVGVGPISIAAPVASIVPAETSAEFNANAHDGETIELTASNASVSSVIFCNENGEALDSGNYPDWITASVSENVITYSVTANTGVARTAYMKAQGISSIDGSTPVYSKLITISQLAATSYTITFGSATNSEFYVYDDSNGSALSNGASVLSGTTIYISAVAATGYGALEVSVVDDEDNPIKVTAPASEGDMYSFIISSNVTITTSASPLIAYNLTTSITPGKRYIIVNKNTNGTAQAMTTQNDNNRTSKEVTIENRSIRETEGELCELVVYGPDARGFYTLYDATSGDGGYLYAASSSNNYLKTQETLNANGKWAITFDDENDAEAAVITGQGEYTRNIIRSNGNIFSCYASGQKPIYLYEKAGAEAVATTTSVKLNGSGYATYSYTSALDFTDNASADYSAWQITSIEGDVITFSQLTGSVAAGKGLLLKGTAGATANLNILPVGGATLSTNKLEGITEATTITADQYYGLSGQSFVPVSAGTVPAGKALLPASEVPAQAGVNAFTFVFEGADGVRTVQQVSAAEAEAIFDISGRRLQQMQRGLNIVGGKKVIRKN